MTKMYSFRTLIWIVFFQILITDPVPAIRLKRYKRCVQAAVCYNSFLLTAVSFLKTLNFVYLSATDIHYVNFMDEKLKDLT